VLTGSRLVIALVIPTAINPERYGNLPQLEWFGREACNPTSGDINDLHAQLIITELG
jgi:hypothetical protein